MSNTNRLIYEFTRTAAEATARSSGTPDTDPWVGVLANTPIIPGTVSGTFNETVSATARPFTDTDNGDGTGLLTGTGMSGTINYLTGAVTLSSDANNVDDSTVSFTYHSGAGQNNGGDANADVALTLLNLEGNDVFSRTVAPNRIGDETGLFQVEIDAPNDTPKLALFGRASPEAPWFNIQQYVNSDMDTADTAAAVVAIFPFMRAAVLDSAAIAVTKMSAWLVE